MDPMQDIAYEEDSLGSLLPFEGRRVVPSDHIYSGPAASGRVRGTLSTDESRKVYSNARLKELASWLKRLQTASRTRGLIISDHHLERVIFAVDEDYSRAGHDRKSVQWGRKARLLALAHLVTTAAEDGKGLSPAFLESCLDEDISKSDIIKARAALAKDDTSRHLEKMVTSHIDRYATLTIAIRLAAAQSDCTLYEGSEDLFKMKPALVPYLVNLEAASTARPLQTLAKSLLHCALTKGMFPRHKDFESIAVACVVVATEAQARRKLPSCLRQFVTLLVRGPGPSASRPAVTTVLERYRELQALLFDLASSSHSVKRLQSNRSLQEHGFDPRRTSTRARTNNAKRREHGRSGALLLDRENLAGISKEVIEEIYSKNAVARSPSTSEKLLPGLPMRRKHGGYHSHHGPETRLIPATSPFTRSRRDRVKDRQTPFELEEYVESAVYSAACMYDSVEGTVDAFTAGLLRQISILRQLLGQDERTEPSEALRQKLLASVVARRGESSDEEAYLILETIFRSLLARKRRSLDLELGDEADQTLDLDLDFDTSELESYLRDPEEVKAKAKTLLTS